MKTSKKKKTIEMPKHSDPLMIVMDAIIEYGKKYDEFMRRQEQQKQATQAN